MYDVIINTAFFEVIIMKVPISLIIDDPAPVISSFYECAVSGTTSYAHAKERQQTKDGRPLLKKFPNEFLFRFCDIIEQYGIKGKFTVIPMPGNKGDIVRGLEGVSKDDLSEWIDTVKSRVAKNFTIGPEMLTHNKAVDLKTGLPLSLSERDWASTQDRSTLTPYISKALSLLREAGLDAFGVTSPWNFGIEVEDEYAAAISRAVYEVTGKKNAWYFLRGLRNTPNAKPWVALEEEGRVLVSIPATTRDKMWKTMDTTESSREYMCSVADELITSDGKSGEIIQVLETGGYPILVTHWQSLISNGLCTGMSILAEVAKRVNSILSDKVEWMSFEEIMNLVISNKKDYPKPIFE